MNVDQAFDNNIGQVVAHLQYAVVQGALVARVYFDEFVGDGADLRAFYFEFGCHDCVHDRVDTYLQLMFDS